MDLKIYLQVADRDDEWLALEPEAAAVIIADVKDPKFFAAMFENDDSAVPDMTPDELKQARRYVLHGEGTVPRECRRESLTQRRQLALAADERGLIGGRQGGGDHGAPWAGRRWRRAGR